MKIMNCPKCDEKLIIKGRGITRHLTNQMPKPKETKPNNHCVMCGIEITSKFSTVRCVCRDHHNDYMAYKNRIQGRIKYREQHPNAKSYRPHKNNMIPRYYKDGTKRLTYKGHIYMIH